MAKPDKGTRITQATVDAAVRDARAGVHYDHPDPECKGLGLRVGGKVVWSFRGPRLGGKNPRFMIGDHTTPPKLARERAWKVRARVTAGLDPSPLINEWLTGLKPQEQIDLRVQNRPSWKWEDAIARYSDWLTDNRRTKAKKDALNTLRNTPELSLCSGRLVCDIVREEIEEAVDKVRLRGVKTHHKKVLAHTRRFFNWMAEGPRRRETSVPVNFLLGAKAGDFLRNVTGRRVVNKGIPDALPIGRALAIARSGVLGFAASKAIELVIGTVQRRRPVVALRHEDIRHDHGMVWFMPPMHRKTADRMQSTMAHQVPLVGFAADVIGQLERAESNSKAWLERMKIDRTNLSPLSEFFFPVARERRKGVANVQPHMDESTLNHNIAAMPGVAGVLSPHPMRVAFASYGRKFGGFAKGEAATILDHMEGDGDDVTRNYYDLDPNIDRKREMMKWWTSWLDEKCAAAIAADPTLDMSDESKREERFAALRQACYVQRYGQAKWDAKIAKTRTTGAPLWPCDGIEDAA